MIVWQPGETAFGCICWPEGWAQKRSQLHSEVSFKASFPKIIQNLLPNGSSLVCLPVDVTFRLVFLFQHWQMHQAVI